MKYLLLLLLFPFTGLAQTPPAIFTKNSWISGDYKNVQTADSAAFKVVEEHLPNDHTTVTLKYHPGGNNHLILHIDWRQQKGSLTAWYPDGHMQEERTITISNLALYQQFVSYWDSSGVQTIKDGNGTCRSFYPASMGGGPQATFAVENGNIEGLYQTWYSTGAIAGETTYSHGIRNGVQQTYGYKDKRKSLTTYQQGWAIGPYQRWDSTGVLTMQADSAEQQTGLSARDSLLAHTRVNQPNIGTAIVPRLFLDPQPTNMLAVKRAVGYPKKALNAGVQGDVVLRVLVDEAGNYLKHKIIGTPPPLLLHAVEAQIATLQFMPAIQEGKPIKFWVNVPFKFTLQKNSAQEQQFQLLGYLIGTVVGSAVYIAISALLN